MGLGEQTQEFVKFALASVRAPSLAGRAFPAAFSVCELGAQIWHAGKRGGLNWKQGPAHEFWNALGCVAYDCIDANGKGTIKADLNKSLPAGSISPQGGYDVVTDFGTSEHIFDQAQVFRTVHYLCRPGGLILRSNPYAIYKDHGFYCYHPTLLRDLAAANGYEVIYLELVNKPKGIDLQAAFRKGREDTAFAVPVQGKYQETVKL